MNNTSNETMPEERLERLCHPNYEPHLSLLLAFLDAQELSGESALSTEALRPFFEAWYPHLPLNETLETLRQAGLLHPWASNQYALPENLRPKLAKILGDYLENLPMLPSADSLSLCTLVEGFLDYARDEGIGTVERVAQEARLVGGQVLRYQGHLHRWLMRPSFLHPVVPSEGYLLLFGRIAEASIELIADLLVEKASLRHRLTLCDLKKAEKINLTHNALFVHLERYLRRVHGVRLVPTPDFTQALIDRGLLTLEKG